MGVCDAVVSEQMSQIGKEKKRRPKGLEDPGLNSYLSKSAKYLCGASGRITPPGCQSKFGELVFRAPFLWPVGRVRNKAVSEKADWLAGWLASGTLVYMWRALQVTGKMRSDKEQKHFLAIRAEICDEPVCHTVSFCYRGQWCPC